MSVGPVISGSSVSFSGACVVFGTCAGGKNCCLLGDCYFDRANNRWVGTLTMAVTVRQAVLGVGPLCVGLLIGVANFSANFDIPASFDPFQCGYSALADSSGGLIAGSSNNYFTNVGRFWTPSGGAPIAVTPLAVGNYTASYLEAVLQFEYASISGNGTWTLGGGAPLFLLINTDLTDATTPAIASFSDGGFQVVPGNCNGTASNTQSGCVINESAAGSPTGAVDISIVQTIGFAVTNQDCP